MTERSRNHPPDKADEGMAPVTRGIRGRCPRCGEGRLFSGYLKVADSCDVCGMSFHGHDTGDGPVVPILLIIGGIVVGLALALEVLYEPPVWVHLLLWIPIGTLLTLGAMVPLKGMAVGLQYKYRSTEEDARPGGV
ncbi:MAG: hypothetical protein COW30_08910 [Rhodospirillales bacterium CG15_BIG_FIL_POST_REV_8_21_14_020_66_15]|nr:MAG: hypothetical protein COW30_08910 [Rhodospirillales bacterium CG15_BIG_FIL_POST_REV_8_21_14_020_66_15]